MVKLDTRSRVGLTDKQELFIAYYLGESNFNATDAARRAGYSGSAGTLRVTAHDVLTNPNVRARIQNALKARAMSPEEIVSRLSDIARASVDDYYEVDEQTGSAKVDLRRAKERGVLHTVKAVRHGKFGLEVEQYSAIDALDKLARMHRLYGETGDSRITVNVNVELSREQRVERILDALFSASNGNDTIDGILEIGAGATG